MSARRWWIGLFLAAALVAGSSGIGSAQTVVARIGGQLVTSAVRGVGLPGTGWSRMPFTTTAPSKFRSRSRAYSTP